MDARVHWVWIAAVALAPVVSCGSDDSSSGETPATGGSGQVDGGGTGGSSGKDGGQNGGSAGTSAGGKSGGGGAGGSTGGGAGSAGAATGGSAGSGGGTPSGMQLGTNFWNLGWGIWDDVFQPNVDFATADNPWNPAFVQEIQRYKVLRFMDFGQVNDSTEQTWSERTPKSAQPPEQQRLAFEWMIDLCNRANADMWVNLPTRADDDYALQLATLINTNLNASLKVYIEWTNETWNFQAARDYACSQGQALNLDADEGTACAKFYVYRAVRMFQQFETVFGVNSPRVVKVLAGQAVNTWLTQIHLNALSDSTINPTGVTANAYAIAPYFGYSVTDGAASNATDLLRSDITTGENNALDAARNQAETIQGTGMQLLAYEGGQTVWNNADVVNSDPAMYDIYTEYFNAMAPYFTVFNHYLHNGEWSSGGAWGAERYVGQPLSEAHKMRAISDWIDAH